MSKITDDIITPVAISFWDKGECIFNFWSNIYPLYRVGDEISLFVNANRDGQAMFPKAENLKESRQIKRIVHLVEQTVSNEITTIMRVEIHLKAVRKLKTGNQVALDLNELNVAPLLEKIEGKTLDEIVSAVEINLINESLLKNRNNISKVARELGLTRRGLSLKMMKYGINDSKF